MQSGTAQAASQQQAAASFIDDEPLEDVSSSGDGQSIAPQSVGATDASVRSDVTESSAGNTVDANAAGPVTVPGELAPLLSFRGLAPTENVFLLDGVSAEQRYRAGPRGAAGGGASMGTAFAQSAIGSLHVRTGTFDARYGGAGGVVQAESVRGSSLLHGSLSYTVRDSAWAAANPFSLAQSYSNGVMTESVVKPHDLLQEAGGSVAGPLLFFSKALRNRIFGTASLEQQWRDFAAVSSPSDPAFFSLTPTQVGGLGTRGVTAAATNTALNYLASLMGAVPRTSQRTLAFARIDGRAGEHDDLALSYTRSRFVSPSGAGSGASEAVFARGRNSVADTTIRIDALTAHWAHRFGAHTVNEFRALFARDDEFETPLPPLEQEPAISPGGYAPQVNIAAASFVYGSVANALGRQAYPDEKRTQLVNVAQMQAGKHALSLGFDWSRIDERISDLANLTGSFTYDSGVTNGKAGGLVDWITDYTFGVNAYPNGGCPSINATVHYFCFRSFAQSFGQQQTEFVLHEFAGFAQDLWQARPGLSVQIGARYEYLLLPLPQQPNVALDAVFGARGATSVFPEDRNNIAPRAAMAWSPAKGKWGTVRLGYGLFYGREPGATVRAALADTALPASATHVRITPKTVTACPQMPSVGFGFPCAYDVAPPSAVVATTSATLYAKNFRLPAVQEFEVSLARDWKQQLSVKVGYSGALAVQLMKAADINIARSTQMARFVLQGGDGRVGVRNGETFVVPLYTARVAPQWGPVTALTSNANATWNAGTVEARWRGWGGFSAHGSYTWSKAIDDGAAQSAVPAVNGQFDPYEIGYDKGTAEFNVPQRYTADAEWAVRLHASAKWFEKTVSGWRLAAIASEGSGRPYSYEIDGGSYLSGGHESINAAGGSTYLPTVGRNTLCMPAQWNLNARLGREFRLRHGERLSASAEAFNVANHRSISKIQTRAFEVGDTANGLTPLIFQNAASIAAEGLNEQPFGAAASSTSSSSGERRLQLGVRLEF